MGIKNFLSLFLLVGTYSCSTVQTLKPFADNETQEPGLSIVTIETPLCSRAVCKISNIDGDTYFMDTPSSINIRSSESDFEVTCFVEEVKEYDNILPMTMWLSADANYLKHDFACPLTDEEVIVKSKLESTPQLADTELDITTTKEQESLQEDKIEQDSKQETDASKLKTADEAKVANETPLTESQIKAIEQLKDLYDKKLISKEVYDTEIAAIKNNPKKEG